MAPLNLNDLSCQRKTSHINVLFPATMCNALGLEGFPNSQPALSFTWPFPTQASPLTSIQRGLP